MTQRERLSQWNTFMENRSLYTPEERLIIREELMKMNQEENNNLGGFHE